MASNVFAPLGQWQKAADAIDDARLFLPLDEELMQLEAIVEGAIGG